MGVRVAGFECGGRFFRCRLNFVTLGTRRHGRSAGITTGMDEPCLLHLRGVFDVKSGACPTTTGTDFQLKNIFKQIVVALRHS
jgi:hypothetical protein